MMCLSFRCSIIEVTVASGGEVPVAIGHTFSDATSLSGPNVCLSLP